MGAAKNGKNKRKVERCCLILVALVVVIALVALLLYRAFSSHVNDGVEKIETADMMISNNIIEPEAEFHPLKNKNNIKNKMKSKTGTGSNIFIYFFILIVVVIAIGAIIIWACRSKCRNNTS